MTSLIGFTGDAPALRPPPVLAFRAQATSVGETITIPAAAKAGDVAALFDYTEGATLVNPAGWTRRTFAITDPFRHHILTKILQAGDPGSVVTGMNGSVSNSKIMLVFSGGVTGFGQIVETKHSLIQDTDPPAATLRGDLRTPPFVLIAGVATAGGTPTLTVNTPGGVLTMVTNSHLVLGYKVYNGAGVQHVVDMADDGTGNCTFGLGIEVK